MFNILSASFIDNARQTGENECNLTRTLEKNQRPFLFSAEAVGAPYLQNRARNYAKVEGGHLI